MTFPKLDHQEIKTSSGLLSKLAFNGLRYLNKDEETLAEKILVPPFLETDIVVADKSIEEKNMCPYAEIYFQATLFPSAFIPGSELCFYRRGIFIFNNKQFLGILKYVGNRTFLSAVTIRDLRNNYPLVKGGIYSISKELYSNNRYSTKKWKRLNVNKLHVLPGRMFQVRDSLRYYTFPHKNLDIAKHLDKNLQTKEGENKYKNYIKNLFAYGI